METTWELPRATPAKRERVPHAQKSQLITWQSITTIFDCSRNHGSDRHVQENIGCS